MAFKPFPVPAQAKTLRYLARAFDEVEENFSRKAKRNWLRFVPQRGNI
jgi:hypothetical protein